MSKKSLILLSFSVGVWIAVFALILFFAFFPYNPDVVTKEDDLHYYSLLKKTGKSLPELLKVDRNKDVYQLFTGNAKLDYAAHIIEESEIRIAEEAFKEVINNSVSFVFYVYGNDMDDQVPLNVECEINASSTMKTKLIKTVDFESELQLNTGELLSIGGAMKHIKLLPSGLTIHWGYYRDNKQEMTLQVSGYSGSCDTDSSLDFLSALDDLLYQTMKEGLPRLLSRIDSRFEVADESSKDATE